MITQFNRQLGTCLFVCLSRMCFKKTLKKIKHVQKILDLPPHTVPVTTRMISFLVGNPKQTLHLLEILGRGRVRSFGKFLQFKGSCKVSTANCWSRCKDSVIVPVSWFPWCFFRHASTRQIVGFDFFETPINRDENKTTKIKPPPSFDVKPRWPTDSPLEVQGCYHVNSCCSMWDVSNQWTSWGILESHLKNKWKWPTQNKKIERQQKDNTDMGKLGIWLSCCFILKRL